MKGWIESNVENVDDDERMLQATGTISVLQACALVAVFPEEEATSIEWPNSWDSNDQCDASYSLQL